MAAEMEGGAAEVVGGPAEVCRRGCKGEWMGGQGC